MYMSDPYKRDYWNRGPKEQLLRRIRPPTLPITKPSPPSPPISKKPNGIIGTPDGKTLYVADIASRKTYSYSIQPDGSLANKTFLRDGPSDGMTIDSEGNIYITGNGVTIFAPDGKKHRPHRHHRKLDRQHLLRRQRPRHPLHHRLQIRLHPQNPHPRRRQPVTRVPILGAMLREGPLSMFGGGEARKNAQRSARHAPLPRTSTQPHPPPPIHLSHKICYENKREPPHPADAPVSAQRSNLKVPHAQ